MTQGNILVEAERKSKWHPFPNYKPSHVQWLGEIPTHWEMKRLKFVARINMGQSPSSEEYELDGEGTPFLQGNAEFGLQNPNARYFCRTAKKFAQCNDYLLSVRAPVGAINIADQTYGIGRGLCAIAPSKEQLDRRFTWYLLQVVRESLFIEATGSTYDAVAIEDVSDIPAILPDIQEQALIAEFLDREIAKIDALIAKKERLIDLLQEKRTALISHAVTKGLDPNAPMKDSGIEWLGEIPRHWQLKKLKYLADEPLKYGANESAELSDPNLPRFIRITDINEDGSLRDDTFRSLPENIAKEFLLKRGDLLFARSGATIGKTFMYQESWGRACYAGYLVRFRPKKDRVLSEFLNCYSSSNSYWSWISSIFIQATIQNVSGEKYSNLISPIPPLSEQHSIVDFLYHETSKIGAFIAKVHEGIERLKEYRIALISAAATGKIDVRNLQN